MVGAGVVYLPLHMATRSCELALILYDAAKDVPVTTTAMNYVREQSTHIRVHIS